MGVYDEDECGGGAGGYWMRFFGFSNVLDVFFGSLFFFPLQRWKRGKGVV